MANATKPAFSIESTTFNLPLPDGFGGCDEASALAGIVCRLPGVDQDSVSVHGQMEGDFPFWLRFTIRGDSIPVVTEKAIRAAVAKLGKE